MIEREFRLTIMISTLGDGIFNLQKTVSLIKSEICYLIIHQTDNSDNTIPPFLIREDITIIKSNSKGLSKSRNLGLNKCTTEYALIADDDIEYIEEGLEKVLEIIKNLKPDFATFKIKTFESEPVYKNYSEQSFKIDNEKRHYYSSIEMLLNVSQLKKNNIHFDESFGLGTPLKAAEEHILVHDMIKKGFTGFYFPVYIVKHSYVSSGKEIRSYNFKIFIRGAINARTNNYNYSTASKSFFRVILNYIIYFYGILYIKLRIPQKFAIK